MVNKHATLAALFTDIADAIREKTGDAASIVADDFPSVIRKRLQVIPPYYLTFSSPNSFTLAVNDATKHWDGTLEYSTDTSTWSTWDGVTTLSSATSGSYNVLYLRGTGNTKIGYYEANTEVYIPWVINGTDVRCDGNIETLLDYATVEAGQHPTMADDCFGGLFMRCTSLTKAPDLPVTTLASYCYRSMFSGCTSLTQAPALPATTLATRCYSAMFSRCTSPTQAPALPATTLENYCYHQMFFGCTALIQAPALPATTLAKGCYYYMFDDCTSLTQAPALPATTLAYDCYSYMFNSCTSLTQAPALPATTLARYCYYNMFNSCTSLTKAPALPATMLANDCYSNMFYDCTSLTQAPALPATTLADSCYYAMFQGCTSLTQAPALPATTLADRCYDSMFRSCKKIKLSSTKTDKYTIAYRIPTTGTGTTASMALNNMFYRTGGTFNDTPVINTTYYLDNSNTIV